MSNTYKTLTIPASEVKAGDVLSVAGQGFAVDGVVSYFGLIQLVNDSLRGEGGDPVYQCLAFQPDTELIVRRLVDVDELAASHKPTKGSLMARKTFKAGDTLAFEDIHPGMKVSRRKVCGDLTTTESFTVARVDGGGRYAYTAQGLAFYAAGRTPLTLNEDFTVGDFQVGDKVSGEDYKNLPIGAVVEGLDEWAEGPYMCTSDGWVNIYGYFQDGGLDCPRTIVHLPLVVVAA